MLVHRFSLAVLDMTHGVPRAWLRLRQARGVPFGANLLRAIPISPSPRPNHSHVPARLTRPIPAANPSAPPASPYHLSLSGPLASARPHVVIVSGTPCAAVLTSNPSPPPELIKAPSHPRVARLPCLVPPPLCPSCHDQESPCAATRVFLIQAWRRPSPPVSPPS